MSTPQPGQPVAALERVAYQDAELQQFMPMLPVDTALARYNELNQFVARILRKDVDYGVIPGTEKRTLLKPGAEKLTTFFGFSTRFILVEKIEDWSGEEHGGSAFFYYLYRCQLYRGDLLIAESDGSCNSRETKYRWRAAERKCPDCGAAAIIKGREEFGGGWVCFKKKGGCGAKFTDDAPAITGQQAGRVENPDICDLVNTFQKMSQKRAMVGAVLLGVNASEFFTQDVEDFDANVINVTPNRQPQQPQPKPAQNGPQRAQRPAQQSQPARPANGNGGRQIIKRIEEMRDKAMQEHGVPESVLNDALGPYGCMEVKELTDEQAPQYLSDVSKLLNESLQANRSDFDDEYR